MTTLTLCHPEGTVIATFPCFINEEGYVEAELPSNPMDVAQINRILDAVAGMEIFQAVEIALCHINEGKLEQGALDSENPDGIHFAFSDL